MKDRVVFKRDWYDSISYLNPEEQAEVYTAFFEFTLNENVIELQGSSKSVFELIKRDIAKPSKAPAPTKKQTFIPPTEEQVVSFFKSNGYKESVGSTAYRYYSVANWIDSQGNKVRNWKQKMLSVWFTEKNKDYAPKTYASTLTDEDKKY
jgi:hypothetical protein